MDPHAKIFDRAALAVELEAARGEGARVVLCNGVFDLLHVGHVRALLGAAACGDVLVVALNSDATARALKGEDRPLQPAEERAEILAALAAVDYVTVFEETTVARTIELLRPAVHAKGRDYDPERIPADEREIAAALGVELALVGDEKTHASSELAARLLAQDAGRPR